MKAAEALEAARSFALATLEQRLGDGGLVVAPHPDDESLACGGLIAEARAQGRLVRVVIVSDGTGSHPASKAYPNARLRDLASEPVSTQAQQFNEDIAETERSTR